MHESMDSTFVVRASAAEIETTRRMLEHTDIHCAGFIVHLYILPSIHPSIRPSVQPRMDIYTLARSTRSLACLLACLLACFPTLSKAHLADTHDAPEWHMGGRSGSFPCTTSVLNLLRRQVQVVSFHVDDRWKDPRTASESESVPGWSTWRWQKLGEKLKQNYDRATLTFVARSSKNSALKKCLIPPKVILNLASWGWIGLAKMIRWPTNGKSSDLPPKHQQRHESIFKWAMPWWYAHPIPLIFFWILSMMIWSLSSFHYRGEGFNLVESQKSKKGIDD